MSTNISISDINRITNSKTFLNKEVLQGLLLFLFKAYKDNKTVKEINIAVDYFKRKNDFIPGDDTIVRVNIFKLRSLLEKYYLEEGKNDELKLCIPKGSYAIKFSENYYKTPTSKKNEYVSVSLILAGILLLSLVLNLILYNNIKNPQSHSKHYVWNDYLQNKKAISIILGDPFFYTEINDQNTNKVFRDVTVNQLDDLPNDKLNAYKPIDYPYFSKNNISPLVKLFNAFSSSKNIIYLQALSELNMDNAKNCNQIFIANINSFGFYKQFLEKTSIRISKHPKQIIVLKGADSTTFESPELIRELYNDYAFMVKIPGTNSNIISLMGDFHGSGLKGLAGLLNDTDKMEAFTSKVEQQLDQPFPKYFEMVIKVSNYHDANFDTEIIYFKKLDLEDPMRFQMLEMIY